MNEKSSKISARRRARECALQAVYSWQLSNNKASELADYPLSKQDLKKIDIKYFHELLFGVLKNSSSLDALMRPYLSRKIKELDQVEKAILRLSLYELSKQSDIPYKVAINEGTELAKIFGAEDSYKFINGVLDKIAMKIKHDRK